MPRFKLFGKRTPRVKTVHGDGDEHAVVVTDPTSVVSVATSDEAAQLAANKQAALLIEKQARAEQLDAVAIATMTQEQYRALVKRAGLHLAERTGHYDGALGTVVESRPRDESDVVICSHCTRTHFRRALALADRTECKGCGAPLPL